MNRILCEIEIVASKSFGRENARKFIAETRAIIDSINEKLGNNVLSRYKKIVLYLWPQSVFDEHPLPDYQYDSMSSVCVKNIPYDLTSYFEECNLHDKQIAVCKILIDNFQNLPKEMETTDSLLVDILSEILMSYGG